MIITIVEESPSSGDAVLLMEELSDTLESITGASGKSSFNIDDFQNSSSFFLIARDENQIAQACGSIRELEHKVGEIKRMYSRVPGLGTQILKQLEVKARVLGYKTLKLETRKINLVAVNFYLKNGYKVTNNYGKYVGNEKAICFQKSLLLNK